MKRTKKKIKVAKQALSRELIEELEAFVENHSARRFSKNLRKMLVEFLMYDGAMEAIYLKDLLWDFEGLFMLLDSIETIQEERSRAVAKNSKK